MLPSLCVVLKLKVEFHLPACAMHLYVHVEYCNGINSVVITAGVNSQLSSVHAPAALSQLKETLSLHEGLLKL